MNINDEIQRHLVIFDCNVYLDVAELLGSPFTREKSDAAAARLGEHVPDGNLPLDHEDGMVYGACRILAGEDPLAQVYCVTRDRGFLAAYREKSLSGHSRVLAPATFVALLRAARTQYSIRRMPR